MVTTHEYFLDLHDTIYKLLFGRFIMRDKLAYDFGIPIAISLLAVGAIYLELDLQVPYAQQLYGYPLV